MQRGRPLIVRRPREGEAAARWLVRCGTARYAEPCSCELNAALAGD